MSSAIAVACIGLLMRCGLFFVCRHSASHLYAFVGSAAKSGRLTTRRDDEGSLSDCLYVDDYVNALGSVRMHILIRAVEGDHSLKVLCAAVIQSLLPSPLRAER